MRPVRGNSQARLRVHSQAIWAGNAPGVSLRYWLNRLRVKLGAKRILVVDIDSTLYPFIPMFVVAAREAVGVDISPEPRTFHQPFDELTREQIQASLEYCNGEDFMDQHHIPFEGAAEALRDLAEKFEVRYYTDRPDRAFALTRRWLRKHGFPNPNRLYTCNGDKRAAVVALRGRAWGILDDKPYTTVWAHYEARIPHIFTIRNSTNWNLDDLPFVHLSDTWNELELELLKRLG